LRRNCNNAVCIFCVIPAKPHAQAKSRLAPVLPPPQRVELSCWLLRRTLRLARDVVGSVIVISRDRALLADAEAEGACGLLETSRGLNLALIQAAGFAKKQGARGLLVLPTDLPRLTTSDLETILTLATSSPALAIAPCRHRTGTNALLMRPPNLIPFAFGPASFDAHCAAARTAGVEPVVYRSDSIAFDLDTPEDWEFEIKKWGIRNWESEIGD
jgi:2-phospho-L-lactate guanylyltransferase